MQINVDDIYCIHNSYLADRGGVRIEIKANQDLVKTPLDLSVILLEERSVA